MQPIDRIALVTDFGVGSPYVGQMKLRLSGLLPQVPVIDLISDLAPFRADLAAYLLPALVRDMPARTLYLCVVDPGVGGERSALAIEADGDWYVGPDNGLLALVARRADRVRVLRVDWRPEVLSASFHGRDLFAPIAASLCDGKLPRYIELDGGLLIGNDWPNALAKVVYADIYGNLITGIQAADLDRDARLRVGGRDITYARTFCAVPPGQAFWYEDAFGLVELAVNQGDAHRTLGLDLGARIELSRH
ncbi:SAM hydrolase/SAM-dependent halogenase family protein [Candidatus Thiosymbion oneisti]|uniref:SAM hydrolase/SAM-dependent halogenase family protein n=1 Tax=Candidatus Thiosymbion oneisti TaxID=589554 RepID=UPI000A6D01AB|nr:SAM-dependent chlorinase/fluorinase [Candidatus Thiosymbion oneisti]